MCGQHDTTNTEQNDAVNNNNTTHRSFGGVFSKQQTVRRTHARTHASHAHNGNEQNNTGHRSRTVSASSASSFGVLIPKALGGW